MRNETNRNTSRFARVGAVGLGAVAVLSGLLVLGTNAWVQARTSDRSFASLDALPARAIAIVPGSPTSRRQVKAALEGRLEGALALYRTGRAHAILVSGIDIEADPETSAMRGWLEAHGIPARDILSDPLGARTRATMARATSVFAIDQAIVCTEGMHMARALFLAQRNGIDAVGFALPSPLASNPRRVLVEALKTTLAVVEETLSPTQPTRAPGTAVALR